MEIKDERKFEKEVFFGELSLGDVFEWGHDIYMKTEKVKIKTDAGGNKFYNTVSLVDANLFPFDDEELVTPLVTQLRILRKD